ncbi:MAG: hypothetical protein GEU80_01555 [Dehalococcoidia bacterium]|nr:hypothetical protein [Dehalococcoidia bacterium]
MPAPPSPDDPQLTALDTLTLEQLEEASGELHRRLGAALRRLGEGGADEVDADRHSPRSRAAALAVGLELASATLGAVAAGVALPAGRLDRHPSSVAAVMYAAPSIGALVARLEQDRRQLASLARTLEHRLHEVRETAWGTLSLRRVLTFAGLAEPAYCAQVLESLAAAIEASKAAPGSERDA